MPDSGDFRRWARSLQMGDEGGKRLFEGKEVLTVPRVWLERGEEGLAE